MKISRLAVGDRTLAPSQVDYAAPPALAQDRHIDGLPLGTRGGMLVHHTFPLNAEYEFTIGGGGAGARAAARRDDRRRAAHGAEHARLPHSGDRRSAHHRRGRPRSSARRRRRRGLFGFPHRRQRFTDGGGVQNVAIMGPFNADRHRRHAEPPRRSSRAGPSESAADEATCARTILSTLARRAYRGPVAPPKSRRCSTFYKQGRAARRLRDGHAGGAGAAAGRAAVPVSHRGGASEAWPPGRPIASATSSSPRACRSSCGAAFRTRSCSTWRRRAGCAIRRRCSSRSSGWWRTPKADAFVENFAGQWLYLRELANVQTEAAGFDDNLRRSFRRETEMLFDTIVREDRRLIELLDADYTFVDERLARHYGIPNVRGSHFRRVALRPDSPRRGLLGHGSMLTVTSIATRTSPVSRGKWILENLLGAPPPSPRPASRQPWRGEETAKTTTLRQRLEQHRANPVVRVVPQHHGPDRVRARELRSRSAPGARRTARRRSTRRGGWPTARR